MNAPTTIEFDEQMTIRNMTLCVCVCVYVREMNLC